MLGRQVHGQPFVKRHMIRLHGKTESRPYLMRNGILGQWEFGSGQCTREGLFGTWLLIFDSQLCVAQMVLND